MRSYRAKAPDSDDRDTSRCPAESLLEAWHRGQLDESTAAAVHGHLESCERCRRVCDELAGGDEIAILLREAERETDEESRKRVIRAATTTLRQRRADLGTMRQS